MRYEHIEWNLSTATCSVLQRAIEAAMPGQHPKDRVYTELLNCVNELRARLQRRDQDPHVPSEVLARKAAIDPLLA